MIETHDITAATAAAAKKNVSQSTCASRYRFGSMVPSWMNRLPAPSDDGPGLWRGWGGNSPEPPNSVAWAQQTPGNRVAKRSCPD